MGREDWCGDLHIQRYIIIIFLISTADKCGVNFARSKCEVMSVMSLL